MKHLKVYEDYTQKEIDDLLGSLGSVGQVDKVKVSCMVEAKSPQSDTHPSWWTEYLEIFAITEFVDRGSEAANKSAALEEIRKGNFAQVVEGWRLSTNYTEFSEIPKVVSRENIQRISSEVSDLDSLVQRVREEVVDFTIREWEGIHKKRMDQMTDSEIEKFYSTEWRSSPRMLRNTIASNIPAEIKVKKIKE